MTTNAGATIIGIFDDQAQAEQAINDLSGMGFNQDQIRYAGHGAASGGFIATLKSLFTGTSTGAAYNDLVDLGVPDEDARYYQQEYEAGHSIVAVLAGARSQEAAAILARYGGYGANQRSAQRGYDTAATDYAGQRGYDTAATDYADQRADTEDERSLRLREEQLRVQKQSVQTGEVRLGKEVVTEQQSVDVPTTREEVYVERRPGSGQPSDRPIGEGETINVPVREEQVTVEKQPVERGEVRLGKRQVQDQQRVSDTVRREEARIERAGDVNVQGENVDDLSDRPDQTTP